MCNMDKMLTAGDLTFRNLELSFLLTQGGHAVTVGRSEANSKIRPHYNTKSPVRSKRSLIIWSMFY